MGELAALGFTFLYLGIVIASVGLLIYAKWRDYKRNRKPKLRLVKKDD